MQTVAFGLLAAITLGAAIMAVTTRNLFRAALWLILAFLGSAGIFLLLHAEFLAITQVLVYVGAISTLIIFAIMLSRAVASPDQRRFNRQWGLVGGAAALLFMGLAVTVTRIAWPVAVGEAPPDAIERLGTALVGSHVVPFEAASVLLVVALIGAIVIAREKE